MRNLTGGQLSVEKQDKSSNRLEWVNADADAMHGNRNIPYLMQTEHKWARSWRAGNSRRGYDPLVLRSAVIRKYFMPGALV